MELKKIVESQKQFFYSNQTKSVPFRKEMLNSQEVLMSAKLL